jgi:4-carboxymuconolactone decarboxylase
MKQDLDLDIASASERAALDLWSKWAVPLCRKAPLLACPVAASVATASGRLRLLQAVVERAQRMGEPRLAIEEALLQTYLFAGYPRAIEALNLLSEIWPATERPVGPSRQFWSARGERLCRRVYGRSYRKMRSNIERAHPQLAEWMVDEGYGKVLSRAGLDPISRELCAIGALAVLSVPRQLEAHVRGARNVGATPRQVALAVRLAALGCGIRSWREARRIASRARAPRT